MEKKDEIKTSFEEKKRRLAMSQKLENPKPKHVVPDRNKGRAVKKHNQTSNARLTHTKQRRPVFNCKLVMSRRSLTKSIQIALLLRQSIRSLSI